LAIFMNSSPRGWHCCEGYGGWHEVVCVKARESSNSNRLDRAKPPTQRPETRGLLEVVWGDSHVIDVARQPKGSNQPKSFFFQFSAYIGRVAPACPP
jgi:hypothetical protein